VTIEPAAYCREIERYLCQKNDGHLIRVVGPSFDLVSGWAARGVPLKIAFGGIDRYFERYYRSGPRRRPVRIDSCEADVLDVFDEWRRATGLTCVTAATSGAADDGFGGRQARRGPSLPAHLERVLLRLTDARAAGTIGPEADPVLDSVSQELDAARSARALRGGPRRAVIARLADLDAQLLQVARARLTDDLRRLLEHEAEEDLAAFRAQMTDVAFQRVCAAAVDRAIRERSGLPTIAFT
jgi:hypothetical protein